MPHPLLFDVTMMIKILQHTYTHTHTHTPQLVLKANGTGDQELLTCAIRPHGIFGPRDPQCITGIINAGRAGKTKFIIGWVHVSMFEL